MFVKSRTRGSYRSKSRNKSLKRSSTEIHIQTFKISKVTSPRTLVQNYTPGFVDDYFLYKPSRQCMNTINSPFSRFPEKIFAFQALLSKKNFKFSLALQKQLIEWTEHFAHKRKFLVLITKLVKTQLDFFENCELNKLVKLVSKCSLRKLTASSSSANYKEVLFLFFQTISQLPVKIWTGSFLEAIFKNFTHKKIAGLLAGFLNSSLEKLYFFKLQKLARNKAMSKAVVLVLKELIFVKGKNKVNKEICKGFLNAVYEASKDSENALMVNEILKFLDENKGFELDQGLLSSIKLNLSS